MSTPLRLICADLESPPLFTKDRPGAPRQGYEPGLAVAVGAAVGRPVEWVFRQWSEMIPALLRGEGDAIWCGQGITEGRRRLVDFTRPYAIFDEGVLVRAGTPVRGPRDLAGRRVMAIEGSTNMALAETFRGAEPVPFHGESEDVLGDMVRALERGEVDAVVDDEVALLPLCGTGRFEVAFSSPTRNRWGVAVSPQRPQVRDLIDDGLARIARSGELRRIWQRWIPALPFPLEAR